jgi:hypothetical protein
MVSFFLFLSSCVSDDPITYVPPKDTCVTVLSGSISMHIHGWISPERTESFKLATGDRNLFAGYEVKRTFPDGTETLDKEVTLGKGEDFQHILPKGESVAYIMTAQTEEAVIEVIDGSSKKEYTIKRRRPIGLMVVCVN